MVPRKSASLVPWAVLGLGLATTATLYVAILRVTGADDRALFESARARLDRSIDDALGRQALILDATAGAIAAHPTMTRTEFRAFYDDLRQSRATAIPASVGFSIVRPWARRSELIEDARRRGVSNAVLRPVVPRAQAYAIVLVEPLDGKNTIMPGYDMDAEPIRHVAIDLARKTGRPTLTARLVLAIDQGREVPSFILYRPVYAGIGSKRRFLGMAFCGLRAETLFGSLDEGLAAAHVGLRVWSDGRRREDLVYSRGVGDDAPVESARTLRPSSVDAAFSTEYVPLPDFGAPATVRRWLLPVGVALSLLLFALARALHRSQRESERRAEEQALLAETGRLGSTADSGDVLQEIAERAARTFEAVCRIDLLEADGGLRTFDTRPDPSARKELESRYPRARHDLLFRNALATGQTQRERGYHTVDDDHRALVEALDAGPVLIAPLWLGSRALGAVTLVRPRGRPEFSSEAAALAEAIAGRLALSIDNTRLYRELEQRVEERTRDLEASNQELESFCYSVSHDLRTPLRSLDGFSRVLRDDYADRLDAQALDYIDRIRAGAKRMDELITALLTLSRLTRREILPTSVDVSAMVREQMQDLDPDGRIDLRIEEGLRADADGRMLAVLFDNLLSNAVKFTARTGRPSIAVGRAEDGSIFVRDNGAGFDMAYAAKLFQPFERLHSVREFPGHGIGLATVERIVRRHGGTVRAESEPGAGATFFVRFPQ